MARTTDPPEATGIARCVSARVLSPRASCGPTVSVASLDVDLRRRSFGTAAFTLLAVVAAPCQTRLATPRRAWDMRARIAKRPRLFLVGSPFSASAVVESLVSPCLSSGLEFDGSLDASSQESRNGPLDGARECSRRELSRESDRESDRRSSRESPRESPRGSSRNSSRKSLEGSLMESPVAVRLSGPRPKRPFRAAREPP